MARMPSAIERSRSLSLMRSRAAPVKRVAPGVVAATAARMGRRSGVSRTSSTRSGRKNARSISPTARSGWAECGSSPVTDAPAARKRRRLTSPPRSPPGPAMRSARRNTVHPSASA